MEVIHELLEDSIDPVEPVLEADQLEQVEPTEIAPSVPLSPKSPTTASTDEPVFSMNVADYQLGAVIGFGSSAIVHMATFLPLSLQVAIKMIELDHFDRHRIDELRKEIQVMTFCKHPNLLGIHTSFVHESKLWIVTPFLAGGSCLDLMKTGFKTGFEEAAIATILVQALQGLQYLHEHGHIHRDVKCGNLLMAEDGLVQLADFGVSASLTEEGGERKGVRKTYVGTPCWMAPEVMEFTRGYDFKADIWSFGITALELAYGHAPYAKFPPMKVIYLTLSGSPPTLDRKQCSRKYSRAFKDMIDCCLQRDPNRRPTARALLKHPFFKGAAKKPAYLQETVLSRVPPVDLRDKSAQMKARGYAAVVANGLSGAAVETSSVTGEETAEEGEASVLSAEESWDFSLDSATAIPEEDESEGVVEGEGFKDVTDVAEAIDVTDVTEAIEPITEPTSSSTTTQSASMVSPSMKQSRFIVDDEDTGEVALAEADDPNNPITDGLEESSDGANRSTSPPSGTSLDTPTQSHHPTEVKKGRFSVLEAVDSADEHPSSDTEVMVEEESQLAAAAALSEEGNSRFEVQGEFTGATNDAFKGFAGISRPPSTHLAAAVQSNAALNQMNPPMAYGNYGGNYGYPSASSTTGYSHPSQVPPTHPTHPTQHLPAPYPHHPQLESLLQMNEYIRSQLLELKHQQEWLTLRTHATINPVPQPHPMLPTSHSHPNLYMVPQHPAITSPPPHPGLYAGIHHPAYYAPPPSATIAHHQQLQLQHHQPQHLPVSPVYNPSTATEVTTPATSLADSSSSLALNSILRELEAVRRENEALKVTLHKQQQQQ